MSNEHPWYRNPATSFIALFFLLVLGLNIVIGMQWFADNLLYPYTRIITQVSAGILGAFGYDIQSADTIIRSPQFAVDIRRGCDGVVATTLLASACLAYPAGLSAKLLGTLLGYLLIFVLNQARIVVLFILGEHGSLTWFDFVHTYVAQFAVIALTMVYWVYWAGRQKPIGR